MPECMSGGAECRGAGLRPGAGFTPAWGVDRRVTLGALVSVATSLVMAAALVAGLGARLDGVEQRLGELTRGVEAVRSAGVEASLKLGRVEERVAGVQEGVGLLRDELRQRRGAGGAAGEGR
ncbi:MAG: hypothetical protein AB7D57_01595 [Desulfovibrionaceae bacterium]